MVSLFLGLTLQPNLWNKWAKLDNRMNLRSNDIRLQWNRWSRNQIWMCNLPGGSLDPSYSIMSEKYEQKWKLFQIQLTWEIRKGRLDPYQMFKKQSKHKDSSRMFQQISQPTWPRSAAHIAGGNLQRIVQSTPTRCQSPYNYQIWETMIIKIKESQK